LEFAKLTRIEHGIHGNKLGITLGTCKNSQEFKIPTIFVDSEKNSNILLESGSMVDSPLKSSFVLNMVMKV
jgi:hypothetical protein